MIVKRIFLEEGNPEAWIDACIADPVRGFTRRAMLVIPGGGYGAVCSDREGEPIALAFMAEGFNAFVLHYTVGRKKPYPAQLREASLAMAHIRTHAEEYGVDPHRVFTVGFSAGGHLAGSLAVLWHREEAWKDSGIEYGQNRPDGAVLVYPVVSGTEYFREGGTFSNLGLPRKGTALRAPRLSPRPSRRGSRERHHGLRKSRMVQSPCRPLGKGRRRLGRRARRISIPCSISTNAPSVRCEPAGQIHFAGFCRNRPQSRETRSSSLPCGSFGCVICTR